MENYGFSSKKIDGLIWLNVKKKLFKLVVFVDIQRFVNYSKNDANMTPTSIVF